MGHPAQESPTIITVSVQPAQRPLLRRSRMKNKKHKMPRGATAALLLVSFLAQDAGAATWQLSAGATLEEGGAFEVARRSKRWELALGYVTEQRVLVNYITPTCPYLGAPPDACTTDVRHVHESVDPYAYFSVQRRFEFRQGARLRPLAGLGIVAQSDTNEYVSTPVNFSLSLGLAVGERVSLEWRHFSNGGVEGPNLGQDTVLMRWRFP